MFTMPWYPVPALIFLGHYRMDRALYSHSIPVAVTRDCLAYHSWVSFVPAASFKSLSQCGTRVFWTQSQ
jgi:hypothetical protein